MRKQFDFYAYTSNTAGKYYIKVTPGIFYSDIQYTLTFTQGE